MTRHVMAKYINLIFIGKRGFFGDVEVARFNAKRAASKVKPRAA